MLAFPIKKSQNVAGIGGECNIPSSTIAGEDGGTPLPSVEEMARLLREQQEELRDLVRATVAAEKHERAYPLPDFPPKSSE